MTSNKKATDLVIDIITSPDGGGEGCELKAYWDKHGKVWTIGWGCTGSNVKEGLVWSQDQADAELRRQVDRCLAQALKASPILAGESESRQAAITDFIYNLGIGKYLKSTLKKRVDEGDWVGAADQIKLWRYACGMVLPGLVVRREKEAKLLEK